MRSQSAHVYMWSHSEEHEPPSWELEAELALDGGESGSGALPESPGVLLVVTGAWWLS